MGKGPAPCVSFTKPRTTNADMSTGARSIPDRPIPKALSRLAARVLFTFLSHPPVFVKILGHVHLPSKSPALAPRASCPSPSPLAIRTLFVRSAVVRVEESFERYPVATPSLTDSHEKTRSHP